MPFPDIDPILFQIGPLAIRWYSLAYVAGLVLGLAYIKCLSGKFYPEISEDHLDDFLVWATIGVVIGGRLGYVSFYAPSMFLNDPVEVFKVWHGGMSFHGGLLGVSIATVAFCKRHKINLWAMADLLACAAPIGLFFGRIANFINGELFGRVTDVSWGVIFPHGGPLPRHPSQLYEAALEGVVLFLALNVLVRIGAVRGRLGLMAGVFFLGYGAARSVVELFRQPDAHLGFIFMNFTMGQLLSLPMVAFGVSLLIRSFKGEARGNTHSEAKS